MAIVGYIDLIPIQIIQGDIRSGEVYLRRNYRIRFTSRAPVGENLSSRYPGKNQTNPD